MSDSLEQRIRSSGKNDLIKVYAGDLVEILDAANARIETLKAALKPFANYASCIMPEYDDDHIRDTMFTCGEFRAAAEALRDETEKR